MFRTAVALSTLVLLAWGVLTAITVQSGDAFVGVAVLVLAGSALLALAAIWLGFALAWSVSAARRAGQDLRG